MPRHELQLRLRALLLPLLTEAVVLRQCEAVVVLPEPLTVVVAPPKAAEAPTLLRVAATAVHLLTLHHRRHHLLLRGALVRHTPEEVLHQEAPEVQVVRVDVDNPFTNTF